VTFASIAVETPCELAAPGVAASAGHSSVIGSSYADGAGRPAAPRIDADSNG